MKKIVGSVVLAAAVVGGWATVVGGQATGVTRTEVGRGETSEPYRFEGPAGTDLVVSRVRFEPGASTGWHSHPGGESAVVLSGTLTLFRADTPGCEPQSFSPGQAVIIPGGVHQAKNLGTEPAEVVATHYAVPHGAPSAAPADRPGTCPE